jgi:hypothetical protein
MHPGDRIKCALNNTFSVSYFIPTVFQLVIYGPIIILKLNNKYRYLQICTIIAWFTLDSETRAIIANAIAESVYKAGGGYNDAYTNSGFGLFFAVKIGDVTQPVHTHGWIFGGLEQRGESTKNNRNSQWEHK